MLRLYSFHATRCVPTIRKGFNCFNTFNKVKRYSVYLSEPISYEVTKDFFDKESGQWKERTVVQRDDTFEFHDLRSAKAFIKKHFSLYKGSSITKFWANGDWENLGPIKLSGSNKHFVANTRQQKPGY